MIKSVSKAHEATISSLLVVDVVDVAYTHSNYL